MQSSLILFVWPLGHQYFPFHLYVQFDIAHSNSVVTSNAGLVDYFYVCDKVIYFPHMEKSCFREIK